MDYDFFLSLLHILYMHLFLVKLLQGVFDVRCGHVRLFSIHKERKKRASNKSCILNKGRECLLLISVTCDVRYD